MAVENIVVLVGGVGGAKFALGLAQIAPPENLTVIVNTGDDFWHLGLRVCPDLDTIMYTLAGVVDPENGWGVAGDTRNMLDMLDRYGEKPWFGLGDKDLATHLLRTQMWCDGCSLTTISQELAARLGIKSRILPMTDAPVATIVDTVEHGELGFQSYFVRYRWQPTVKSLRYEGVESAQLSPQVETALDNASAIFLGPSNPWLSIAPILAVPGLRDRLLARAVPRVAITPIVKGAALKGPAAKLMAELGYVASAASVAEYYKEVINGFVYDRQDQGVKLMNCRTIDMDTVMYSLEDKIALAQNVLAWVRGWE